MHLTQQQKTAAALGAAAIGAVALARAWRRRDAYDFAGRSVLITGGSRGLGLVMAREFAAEGAHLTLLARDAAELERAAADIRARHPSAVVLPVAADVRQRTDVERAIAQAIDRHGRIDVLVNNAGIIQTGPVDHMTPADFEDSLNTHFWGPLFAILSALPHMRRQGEGRIVNISSIGGRLSVPHLLPYCAGKFALTGLSDGLRVELARHNVVVTTVCPGLMRTGSPVNALFKGRRPEEYAWFAISDSLPLTSIDAGRAARQIVEACRRGDAELVITFQARLAILARTMAPELTADILTVINRLLPGPVPGGEQAKSGRESQSALAPSVLTTLTDRAAVRNNEN